MPRDFSGEWRTLTADLRSTVMSERSENVLSNWRQPNGLSGFFNRRIMIASGVVAVLFLLGFGFLRSPTSGEVRLDTGDIRYCWWGIPLKYERMAEPQRSKLLALASKSPVIPAKWVTCTEYSLSPEYRPDRMCQGFYWSIAIWSDEDSKIARWAMDDVVEYLNQNAKCGLPQSVHLLNDPIVDWHARKVNADWRDQDAVKSYCAAHGYVLPPPSSHP